MKEMRISRIELENWMNFRKVELELASRVFVIGPNASGKSNLLNSFRFLHDLVTQGGGLARAIEERGSMTGVRSLFARNNSTVRVAVDVVHSNSSGWSYSLEFTHERPGRPQAIVKSETVGTIGQDGRRDTVLQRPDKDDNADPERLKQTAIEQVSANREFRELADFFRSIQYLHAVPHLIREGLAAPDRMIGVDPYGRNLLQRVSDATAKTRTSRLRKIENVLRNVTPQLTELQLVKDSLGRPHLQAKFKHWRPNGAFQKETQFSDGTLRLIGLLWALQESGGLLLLEEPELSLHPQVVARLGPLIHRVQRARFKRQILLSTHSIELLSDEGIAPNEVVLIESGKDGSTAKVGASDRSVRQVMEAGVPAGDAVMSRPAIIDERQLTLAFEEMAT